MCLSTNNNSVFELKYKLVLKIIDVSWLEKEYFLKKSTLMFLDIAKGYGVTKQNIELKENILIIRFKARPNTEISKFVNAYKSATSRKVKRYFGRGNVDKAFWDKGYLLLTLGEDSDELVYQYMVSGK